MYNNNLKELYFDTIQTCAVSNNTNSHLLEEVKVNL